MRRDPIRPYDQDTTAGDVKERVSDIASRLRDKTEQFADTASDRFHSGRGRAAEGLDRAASALHDKADSVPGGPRVVDFTHKVAGGMESTASYIRDHDLGQVGQDVINICRRHPAQSLITALALGFLLGRTRR